MEIKLSLTIDETNLVLRALRKLPMEEVLDTHTKIMNHAKEQLVEQEKLEKAKAEKETKKEAKN